MKVKIGNGPWIDSLAEGAELPVSVQLEDFELEQVKTMDKETCPNNRMTTCPGGWTADDVRKWADEGAD